MRRLLWDSRYGSVVVGWSLWVYRCGSATVSVALVDYYESVGESKVEYCHYGILMQY